MTRLIDRVRHRCRANEAGFTLLEIMIALALLTLIVVPATTFMLNMQKSEKVVRDSTLQQANARIALERVSRAMREGSYPDGHTWNDSSIFMRAVNSFL